MKFNGILSAAFAAVIALAAVACQKIEEQPAEPEQVSAKTLTVTATIADIDGTKVGYAFTGTDADKAKSAIKQTWEVNDQIFGFDEDGDTFTFTVSEVDQLTGKATFIASETNLNGTLYAVYYPGNHTFVGDGTNKTLEVDLTSNNGVLNGTTKAPVIMCAKAPIGEDGNVSFTFTNQTAIVGIYKMQIFDEGKPVGAKTSISSVTLNGVYTKGKIQLESGKLGLVADSKETGSITANGLSLSTVDNGFINASTTGEIKPYFSVIPGGYTNIEVTASNDDKTYTTTGSINGTLLAGTYYYIGKKIGIPVASIGDTKYFTISDAFNAVQNGQTIKLENNCTVDKQSIVSSESDTKTVTLNLNGKTLKQNGTTRLGVGTNGYLKIEDAPDTNDNDNDKGTITQNNEASNIFAISAGTLEINGGEISQSESATCSNIWVSGDANLVVSGGQISSSGDAIQFSQKDGKCSGCLNIKGNATISSANGDAVNFASSTTGDINIGANDSGEQPTIKSEGGAAIRLAGTGGLDISAGTIISTSTNAVLSTNTVADNKQLAITGGFFCGRSNDQGTVAPIYKSSSGTDFIVSGGSFIKKIDDSYLDENCQSCYTEINEEYPWEVVNHNGVYKALFIATNGNTYELKAIINDAVSAANSSGGKIILVDDCTVNGTTAVNVSTNGVTLDLNGKKLTQNKAARVGVTTGGKLTIIDSQKDGEITQASDATNQYTISVAAGQLDIESGTISNTDNMTVASVYVGTSGILNFKGGEIKSGTNDGEANHALYVVGSAQVNITGGTITGNGTAAAAIRMYNQSAQMTIEGDVSIDAPNIDEVNKTTVPVILLSSGTCNLKEGTIGKKEGAGHYTAIQIVNGKLNMEGGTIYAQRFAIYFNGTTASAGKATITDGQLINTKDGYNIVRFAENSKNDLIFNGGYLYSTSSETKSGTLFGTGRGTSAYPTNNDIPDEASVTINKGYFSENLTVNYNSCVPSDKTVSQGTFINNDYTYVCKVE